jgi:hypothetical protein
MKEQRWLGLTIVLMLVVFAVCLPVIVPVVAVQHALYYWRMRAAARKFACLSCGSYLGSDAIRLADEAWSQHFSDLQAKNPGVRFRTRIVRDLRAICPHCGARYGFLERERTFVALGDDVFVDGVDREAVAFDNYGDGAPDS